ncbi:AraC family transcriptional regulator [Neobacillus drentensis]|uniref:helix-turn-helix domain-containing protein n=1 Tax=Neobacillus drentensis TaxID=220684 RepID=UPI001F449C8A|nr:AraC family transcriptional regulator [Neobacillus drentensis]ULT58272.1 AraC family transcriptional regulator [Neobacillus drentensis]
MIKPTKTDTFTRYLTNDIKNGILSCGFVTRNRNELPTMISHEYYNCFVLLQGSGCLIDLETGQVYPLSAHSLCQQLPGKRYSLIIDSSEPWYEFHVSIGESTFHSLASLELLNLVAPVFELNLKPYLEQWFIDLILQLKTTTTAELPEVLFNTQKLLINLHRENIVNQSKDIETIISGTKHMLYEDKSLEEIAASFHMSYEKLRKLFKESVGISPKQYRLQTKFHLAERLLTEGYSVKIVAGHVGYHDPFIFSRQFKKYMGKSPSDFKKKPVDSKKIK